MLRLAKLQGDTSDRLLKHLEKNSEFLQDQNKDFSLISEAFDITFVYETKPTPLPGGLAEEVNCLLCCGGIYG